jgi:tRNA pseudouridine55 synthase
VTSEVASPSGILLVDKPEGLSSAQAVAVAKRSLGGVKVGHLGTLDPFASGLLPLCIGEGTKLAPYLNEADKGYRGLLRLGISTDTLDPTGRVVAEAPVPALDQRALEMLAGELVGEILQVPPVYSAIKRDGVPMYRLAREGRAPEMEPRRVTIYSLTLELKAPDRVALEVRCSKGTYVRAIARDLGARLGCGAILEKLVRTAFGRFGLPEAVTLDTLRREGAGVRGTPAFLDVAEAVRHLPSLRADAAVAKALRAGQQRVLGELGAPEDASDAARVLDPAGRLVAILTADRGRGQWNIGRVFG